jgi:hypothetical protein
LRNVSVSAIHAAPLLAVAISCSVAFFINASGKNPACRVDSLADKLLV